MRYLPLLGLGGSERKRNASLAEPDGLRLSGRPSAFITPGLKSVTHLLTRVPLLHEGLHQHGWCVV